MNDGQPQARAFSDLLGGEERFENERQYVFRNPFSGVADPNQNFLCAGRVEVSNGQNAVFFHCVRCIDHDVDDHLLQLSGINEYVRQVGCKISHRPDVLKNRLIFEQQQGLVDDGVDFRDRWDSAGLARKIEQPLHRLAAAQRLL